MTLNEVGQSLCAQHVKPGDQREQPACDCECDCQRLNAERSGRPHVSSAGEGGRASPHHGTGGAARCTVGRGIETGRVRQSPPPLQPPPPPPHQAQDRRTPPPPPSTEILSPLSQAPPPLPLSPSAPPSLSTQPPPSPAGKTTPPTQQPTILKPATPEHLQTQVPPSTKSLPPPLPLSLTSPSPSPSRQPQATPQLPPPSPSSSPPVTASRVEVAAVSACPRPGGRMHVGGCCARKVESRVWGGCLLSVCPCRCHATQDAPVSTMARAVHRAPHLVVLLALLALYVPCAGGRASISLPHTHPTLKDTGHVGTSRLSTGAPRLSGKYVTIPEAGTAKLSHGAQTLSTGAPDISSEHATLRAPRFPADRKSRHPTVLSANKLRYWPKKKKAQRIVPAGYAGGYPAVPWSPFYPAGRKSETFSVIPTFYELQGYPVVVPSQGPLAYPATRKSQRLQYPAIKHGAYPKVSLSRSHPPVYPTVQWSQRQPTGHSALWFYRKAFDSLRTISAVSPPRESWGVPLPELEQDLFQQSVDIGAHSAHYDGPTISHRPRMVREIPHRLRPVLYGGPYRKQKAPKHSPPRKSHPRGPKRNRKHKNHVLSPKKHTVNEFAYEFLSQPSTAESVEEDVTVSVPTEAIRPLLSSQNFAFSGGQGSRKGRGPFSTPMTLAPGVHVVKLVVRETDQKNSTVIITLRALPHPHPQGPLKRSEEWPVVKHRNESMNGTENESNEGSHDRSYVGLLGRPEGWPNGWPRDRPVTRVRRSYKSYGMNQKIRTQMLAHRLSISYRHVQPCDYADRFYCMNGGTCVFVGALDIKTCRCPIGYTGVRCELIDQEYILSLLTDSIIFG